MLRKSCLFVLLLALAAATATADDDGDIHEGQKFSFDRTHWAVFHDIGRKEAGEAITYGKTPVFIASDNDKLTTITLSEDLPMVSAVSSQVYDVHYKDANRLWVVSRLKGGLDGAILLNLATRQIEKAYYGHNFSISPNGATVAFSFYDDGNHESLFANEVMMYPAPNIRFDVSTPEGMKTDRGALHIKRIPAGTHYGSMVSEFRWTKTGVDFVINDQSSDGKDHFILRSMNLQGPRPTLASARSLKQDDLIAYTASLKKK